MIEAEDFYSTTVANCVFNAFLSYTAIMLNIVTIHALRKLPSLPKSLKTLLLSLAVSDLGVGLLVQPLYTAFLVMGLRLNSKNFPTYKSTDDVFHFTAYLLSFVSFFGVTALSADRFLAIHLHLRYQELVTHKRVVAVVILLWIFSAILTSLSFFIQKTLLALAVLLVVCFISTTLFYAKIYMAIQRHKNQIQALQVARNREIVNAARLRKFAVGTFHVYIVFLVCYLPNICILVAILTSGQSTLITHLSPFGFTLVLLNSSLNPLIYCWKMRHIRHAVMDILRRKVADKSKSETVK